jgi:hypothetical protein
MVGLTCLVSQCVKLHVAGWTWAVFIRVYLEPCTWPVAKQQGVDVWTELRQLASDDETFLSRVITGDLAPCEFFLFPKIKLKLKRRQSDTTEGIRPNHRQCLTLEQKRTSRKRSKNEGDDGTCIYMREGTTSRVMATDRPYGGFYDFYSSVQKILETTSYYKGKVTP